MSAKFFVNGGIVTGRADMLNLLRPLLKQTVTYAYLRGGEIVASGTGWIERIVMDEPETSTYFTPLVVCINIDSFEHLEFDTRPDQLLSYTLVQGDERIIPLTLPLTGAPATDNVAQLVTLLSNPVTSTQYVPASAAATLAML